MNVFYDDYRNNERIQIGAEMAIGYKQVEGASDWLELADGTMIRSLMDGRYTDDEGGDYAAVQIGNGDVDEDGNYEQYDTVGFIKL